eukprot:GHVU01162327.1.p1 GENE.GHVU01162327.1~~GHVU01162327.1.p1  ORF type:complete len:119 (-),score=17.45 GHVU01162327.1:166-522(-)
MKTQRHAVIATFVFKYRPLDMLRANNIVPLPPKDQSKKRAASSDEPEILDLTVDGPDSDDEVERRVKALRDELADLERKRRKTSHVKPEPGVKREPGSSSGSKNQNGKTVSLGVVDLT